MQENILETPKLRAMRKQKNKVLVNKILFFSLFVFILFIASIFISHINKLEFIEVRVLGTKILDEEDVSKEVEDYINQKTYFFSKKNVFLYSKNKIKNLLYSNPRIQKVSLYREGFNTLVVEIRERGNSAVWCGESFSDSLASDLNTECFFLDPLGVKLDQAPYFSGNIYLKNFGPLGKIKDKENGFIYDAFLNDKFELILDWREKFKVLNIDLFAFEDQGEDVVFYLSKKKNTNHFPKILFKKDADWDKMLLNIETIFHTEKFKNNFENNFENFVYLDLRYGNKVYYKFGKDTVDIKENKTETKIPEANNTDQLIQNTQTTNE